VAVKIFTDGEGPRSGVIPIPFGAVSPTAQGYELTVSQRTFWTDAPVSIIVEISADGVVWRHHRTVMCSMADPRKVNTRVKLRAWWSSRFEKTDGVVVEILERPAFIRAAIDVAPIGQAVRFSIDMREHEIPAADAGTTPL